MDEMADGEIGKSRAKRGKSSELQKRNLSNMERFDMWIWRTSWEEDRGCVIIILCSVFLPNIYPEMSKPPWREKLSRGSLV